MNKEQRKFKKTIKKRMKRKKFERQVIDEKRVRQMDVKRMKIEFKFEKLERKIVREEELKRNPPTRQVMSPQKVF